jgi:hypothetical protein
MNTRKRTDQLQAGDKVLLVGRHVRTVERVVETQWLNHRNQPILAVLYSEGTTDEWSDGNTGAPGTEWEVVS